MHGLLGIQLDLRRFVSSLLIVVSGNARLLISNRHYWRLVIRGKKKRTGGFKKTVDEQDLRSG